MDRVLLTNLLSLGQRPFTSPGPGGAILVNMGPGFDDPMHYKGHGRTPAGESAPGQRLIHELPHTWQIANESFTPEFYCRAGLDGLGDARPRLLGLRLTGRP